VGGKLIGERSPAAYANEKANTSGKKRADTQLDITRVEGFHSPRDVVEEFRDLVFDEEGSSGEGIMYLSIVTNYTTARQDERSVINR
jgi:hypothetical protein